MKSDFNSYYEKFQWITRKPNWKKYLHSCYEDGLTAIHNGNSSVHLQKKDFTALLSGTSGEVTARFFCEYIFEQNSEAKIIILDIGEQQVANSKELLTSLWPDKDIIFIREDIRQCSLQPCSIDYIDTDALLQFFPYDGVSEVFSKWYSLLKPGGFVTTRILARKSFLEIPIDYFTSSLGGKLFGVKFHNLRFQKVLSLAEEAGFRAIPAGGTFYPILRKISMVKEERRN